MKSRRHARLVLSVVAALAVCWLGAAAQSTAQSTATVDSVQVVSNSSTGSEAKVQTNGDVKYRIDTFNEPARVMISFQDMPLSDISARQDLSAPGGLVKSVRALYVKPGQLNALVFDLSVPGKVKIDQQGNTLAVSLTPVPVKPAKAAKTSKKDEAKDLEKQQLAQQTAEEKARATQEKAQVESKPTLAPKKADLTPAAPAVAVAPAAPAKVEAPKAEAAAPLAAVNPSNTEGRTKTASAIVNEEAKAQSKEDQKAQAEALKLKEKKAKEEKAAALEKEKADKKAALKKEKEEKEKARAQKKEDERKAAEKAKQEKADKEKALKQKKEDDRKAAEKAKADKKAAEDQAKADKKAGKAVDTQKSQAVAAGDSGKAVVKESAAPAKTAAAPAPVAVAPAPAAASVTPAAEKASTPPVASKSGKKMPEPKALPAPVPPTSGPMKDRPVIEKMDLTLDDCVSIALRNNEKMKIMMEEVALAKLKVDEAKQGLWPKFILKDEEVFGKTTQDFEGRHLSSEFQIPLYSGGKLTNTLLQAKINLAVALMNFRKEKLDFLVGIQQSYFSFASAKDRAVLKEQLLKDADLSLDEMTKRAKIGTIRELELMDMQIQQQDIKSELETARHDVELARISLLQMMDVSMDSKVDVKGMPAFKAAEVELAPLMKAAVRSRPDIRVNELLVDFNRYGIKIAESEGRFNVDLSGSAGIGDEWYKDEDPAYQGEWYAGVKAGKTLGAHKFEDTLTAQDKVPSAGQTTSTKFVNNTAQLTLFANNTFVPVKEAKIKYYRAMDELDRSRKTTEIDVRKALYEYQRCVEVLRTFDVKLQYGRKELEITRAQKDINQAVIADVLKVQGKLSTAQADYIKAQENAFVAAYKLNREIGVAGYVDPFAGARHDDLIPAARPDAVVEAGKEQAWYKFWIADKSDPKVWAAKYPESVEAGTMVEAKNPTHLRWYNLSGRHDYRLLFIDEPLTDWQQRKLEKQEKSRVKAARKAEEKKQQEAARQQEQEKRKADQAARAEAKAKQEKADKDAADAAKSKKAAATAQKSGDKAVVKTAATAAAGDAGKAVPDAGAQGADAAAQK